VSVRDELQGVLARLLELRPGPLTMWPQLDSDSGQEPPFAIGLAPWSVGIAEDLHRQFGDDVELTVGALPYPPGRPQRYQGHGGQPADLLDPGEVAAELDGPAVIGSGHTLWHGLLLRNLTDRDLEIVTNGQVTAEIVDPRSGEVVGGYPGMQTLKAVVFAVAPATSERIPLLIGTASYTPRLGYAIPAGEWGIQVTLKLGRCSSDALRRRTPVLPLTVTG
jgi:hypothetical protein